MSDIYINLTDNNAPRMKGINNIVLDENELYIYLCHALRCTQLIFNDRFHEHYIIHHGQDEELHVYQKLSTGEEVLYDDRGELYKAMIDLGEQLIPNWDNRWPAGVRP